MKIHLAALTLTLAGLSPSFLTSPASPIEPVGTAKQAMVMPTMDLVPSTVRSAPVPLSALREESTASAGIRIARLDDRVSNLKARADLSQARAALEPDFEALKKLRGQIATALTNLRNPEIGYDAAQKTLDDAVEALDLSLAALAAKLERLDRAQPPRVS